MTAPDPRLGEIEGRLSKATPGPWRWDENYGDENDTGLALTNDAGTEVIGAYNFHCCSYRDDPTVDENSAEFIAAAPADVAYLLAELRKAQDAIGRVEGLAAEWEDMARGGRSQFDTALRACVYKVRAAVAAATGGERG